jgi:hypothetical protein
MMATKNKAPDAPLATPENTPVPGGGSWHWDDTLPGWAENVIADIAEQSVTANPTPETTQE